MEDFQTKKENRNKRNGGESEIVFGRLMLFFFFLIL